MPPIVINARAAARAQIGGVERWAREMSTRLPSLAPGRYVIERPPRVFAHRAGHAWEQAVLPLNARRSGARIIYSPANLAPLAWNGNVVTMHDAVALAHPEWYSRPYVAWQRAVLPRIARRAVKVVTVSEFSRNELAQLLGVDAVVIHGGVDERFHPGVVPEQRERPYVLSVATLGARKALDALEPVADALAAEGIDVLVAGSGRSYVSGRPGPGRVKYLGYVDDERLPGLYAGARAFVLPSLHEGFGLTCLEAMACGTPVVATRAGALPETVGGAGLLVDDPRDLPAAVATVLADSERWRRLGRARAAALTWERAARELDELLAACA